MPAGLAPRLALIGFTLVASALSVAVNELRTSAGIAGAVLAVLIITALSFAFVVVGDVEAAACACPCPRPDPRRTAHGGGADVLDLLTAYWIGNLVARKTNTYGAVGIAIAVLLWVYILGRITVGSAGLNAALWHRRQNRGDLGAWAESQKR